MWDHSERGEAEFRANGWKLLVTADQQGVRLLVCRNPRVTSSARLGLVDTPLPPCRERFIRGDALHLSFSDPQSDPVGFDLVLMAVEADQDRLILESVIAVETSLLDSHPAVELQVGSGQPGQPGWDEQSWEAVPHEPSALWFQAQPEPTTKGPGISTSVFCEQRDQLSLDRQVLAAAGHLRFFGDFLEKGVIRKVQPWWVWSERPVPPREAARIAQQLAARPLPLAR